MDKRNRQSLTSVLAFGLAACGGGGSSAPAADPLPSDNGNGDNGNGGNLPPPFFVPPNDIPLALYENHPTNKAVYDLTPQGLQAGTYRLAADYGDNAMFQVSGDGRIWWQASPDYETPGDTDGDGTYLVRIEHPHNSQGYSDIEVEVDDVVREVTSDEWEIPRRTVSGRPVPEDHPENDYYNFTYDEVKDILPDNDFVKYLLRGDAYALPAEGPLIITWSIVLPSSDLDWLQRIQDDLTPSTDSQSKIDEYRNNLARAFDEFEAVANLKFVEVEDTPEIVGDTRVFVNPQIGNSAAGPKAGPSSNILLTDPLTKYSIYVHEIGHMLGLDHPFDESFGFPGNTEFKYSDRSIMSYNRDWDTEGLQPADIVALQFLYGAPGTDFDGLQARLEEIGITPEIV